MMTPTGGFCGGLIATWLVGQGHPVLKNMTSSFGMMNATQYEWENKIDGNQTTNQLPLNMTNLWMHWSHCNLLSGIPDTGYRIGILGHPFRGPRFLQLFGPIKGFNSI